jgi:RNA polymerase sigma factor (sigma-70 family)
VFDRYYRELLNFLARKVRDRETAADLAQESFVRVYAAEQAGTVIHNPRALLYKTARNLVVDNFRREDAWGRQSKPGLEAPAVDPDEHAGPDTLEPEMVQASRQRFEAIVSIVEALPPRCREAFVLVKFDGLVHADVAQRMGITVKTVEMHIQNALTACWNHLEALDEVTGPRSAQMRRSRATKQANDSCPATMPDTDTDRSASTAKPT